MKNPLIKICGITSEEEIGYIAKAGIDYAGFVLFFPKSKRNLSLECAKKLIAKLPAGVVSVAVTVSPTKEQVEAVVEAGFLAIQIHGKIENSVITSCRIPVFKAFNVSDMDAFSHYEEMDEVAGFVMDAAVPGSGKTFDWDLLQKNVARIHARGNIHQHLDLIAGLPYEDFNTFKKSFCDVYAMKPDQFQLGFLKVLDGSFMNEKRNDYEIQASSLPPYEIFSTKWLSYEDVLSLKGVEEMVEVYYNSFQFAASMIYLERLFKDAYCLYEGLAKEYEEKHLFERKINRRERYEVLYAFGKKHVPETDAGNWQEIITYDWYRRDFAKEKPTFVKPDSETQKREIRAFFDRECETHRYLPGYEGYVTRQLYHMVYLGEYTVDIQRLLKDGTLQKREPYYILFDYKNRNPLNYAAAERILTMDEFTGTP